MKLQTINQIPKLKPRAIDAHKGDFGKVCIIAGSTGMSGAAALAGRAALRAGAGLVQVATPKSVLPIVASIEPSFTTIALPEDSVGRISAKAINPILETVSENDVVAFGPGVGISVALRSVLEALLEQDQLRLVIDADGLNNLAGIKDWATKLKAKLILTGVITALAGQGLSDFDAAVSGVYIHGLAGDIAAENLGQVSLMATDIIQALADAFIRT